MFPFRVRFQLQSLFVIVLLQNHYGKSTAFYLLSSSSKWINTKHSTTINRYSQISHGKRFSTISIDHMMDAERQDFDRSVKRFQTKREATKILFKIKDKKKNHKKSNNHKRLPFYKQSNCSQIGKMINKTILVLFFFLSIFISSPNQPALAVESGGRIGGGSFSRSSSSSRVGTTRSSSSSFSPSRSKYRYKRSRNTPINISPYRSNNVYYSYTTPAPGSAIRRGLTISDVGIIAAMISFAVVGSRNTPQDDDYDEYDQLILDQSYHNIQNNLVGGALGPGIDICQLTVALDVQNRNCADSILSKLNRLPKTAKTDSRFGIQSLLSEGMCIEHDIFIRIDTSV